MDAGHPPAQPEPESPGGGRLLPLLRLLQVADSGFPSGAFAYSHGVEWLAANAPLDEHRLALLLSAYIDQAGAGQWLAAASLAQRASSVGRLLEVDRRLDLSIAAAGERDAGRAMGERLLSGATAAFGGSHSGAMLAAVTAGRSPGQYAVAFAAIARDAGVPHADALAALGAGMAGSVAQAAVRLGLIGQAAAVRLLAGAAPVIAAAVSRADAQRSLRFGSFTPGLEVAAILHPTLPFRMFAS